MINRRKFIHTSAFTSFAALLANKVQAMPPQEIITGKPVVISTWDAGIAANKAAWEVLSKKGKQLMLWKRCNGHGGFAKLLCWSWR
jgi:N4-(beta-N-acetylglucosaminyl)-L-asparaginase